MTMKDLTELELLIISVDIQFSIRNAPFSRLKVLHESIMHRFDNELKTRPPDNILAAVKQLGEIEPELAEAGTMLKNKCLEIASRL